MKKKLCFQGSTIEYELTRKKVKNLNLRLRSDGTVAVSAPWLVPQWQIDRFVLKNAARILEKLEIQQRRAELISCDEQSLILRGRKVDIVCTAGSRNSAAFDGECVKLSLRDLRDSEARQRALDRLCRELAIEWITESSERIFPIFQWAGVKKPELKFRKMKSRWGSCRHEKAFLSFNTALAHVPAECVDYVVMHEYCHFIRPDHSPAFHELMTSLMPDWKARKKILEKYSSLL